ncbi:MAG: gamma carbonic anhydrase family protein [Sporolactobacillus sp.]
MYRFGRYQPNISAGAQLAPDAQIVGQVKVESGVSVWFGTVLRGDLANVWIKEGAVVEDGTIVHSEALAPVSIGREAVIGARSVLQGCTVEDGATIGTGAVLLSGSQVGSGAYVAPGTVVTKGQMVHAGTFAAGNPAIELRALTADERSELQARATTVRQLAARYMDMKIFHTLKLR